MKIKVKGTQVFYKDGEGNLKEDFKVLDENNPITRENYQPSDEVEVNEIITMRRATKEIEVSNEQLDELINNTTGGNK